MTGSKSFFKSEKFYYLLFIVMAFTGVLINLPYCFDKIITYDSSYQYCLTVHSWKEIWRLLPEDYSPPLYTVILKLSCLIFGHTLKAMRFTNSLVIIGLVYLALFPVRKAFGAKTAVVSAVCFICSTLNMYLFPEIRPTYLAYFFVTGTAIYAYLAFFEGKRRYYVCHAVFSLLAMYTHNVAMIIALGIYVVVLLFSILKKDKKRFLSFFVSGVICAVIYIPWLIVVFRQFGNVKANYWKEPYSTFGSLYKDCIQSIIHVDRALYPTIIPTLVEQSFSLLVKLLIIYYILKNLGLKELKKPSDLKNTSLFSKENRSAFFKGLFVLLLFLMPLIIFEILTRTLYPFSTYRYYYLFTGIVIIITVSFCNRMESKFIPIVFSCLMIINTAATHYDAREFFISSNAGKFVETVRQGNPDNNICFLHSHEWTIGLMSYHFPDAHHFLFDDTWTVLNDVSVFGDDFEKLSVPEDIIDYTDHFYIFTPYFPEEETDLTELFNNDTRFTCSDPKLFQYGMINPKGIRIARVDVNRDVSAPE